MSKFLFVTDLDHTLIGDDQALEKLNQILQQHREEYETKIVYATGRSPELYQLLTTEKKMLVPDALVASVGTEIYYQIGTQSDQEWAEIISPGWNRTQIVEIGHSFQELTLQPELEQRPFKVSYFFTEKTGKEILPQLEKILRDRDLDVKLIYSGGAYLDILPRHADKGLAVQYLRRNWGIDPIRTVVCGDSGNDISMFNMGIERGIIVANVQPELRQWYNNNLAEHRYLAKSYCAGGIIEGLKYFGFIKNHP